MRTNDELTRDTVDLARKLQAVVVDMVIPTQNCLQAVCAAIARQPNIDHRKFHADFLEFAEKIFEGPEKVPGFAQALAKSLVTRGPDGP